MHRPKKKGSIKRNEPLEKKSSTEMLKETKEKLDIEFLSATMKKKGKFFICLYCQGKFEWLGPYTKHVFRHKGMNLTAMHVVKSLPIIEVSSLISTVVKRKELFIVISVGKVQQQLVF